MIVVAGENVVDLVPAGDGLLRPVLGGGPANIAVAVARLGAPVEAVVRISTDAFGRAFQQRFTDEGVGTQHLVRSAEPATLALATIDERGSAHFDFWLAGAADFGWRRDELPALPVGAILHLGSLASLLPPGATALHDWAAQHRSIGTVTFDPNLRAITLPHLAQLERLIEVAHVIKVSEDDLLLGFPEVPPEVTCRRWVARGRTLVVLTRGARGVTGFSVGRELSVPAPVVEVVDTIGAGDAAMGALLALIDERGVVGVLGDLAAALRYVAIAGALACTRPGADAPSAAELTAALGLPEPA